MRAKRSAAQPRRGRPPKPPAERRATTVAVRFDGAAVAKIDAYIAVLKEREPAVVWTRGLAVRSLVLKALDGAKPGARRS